MYTVITIHFTRVNVMRELGPSLRNASCKHYIPLGSTSNTYNLNSIAANSSHRSAIWRARHRSSLIRLARAYGSPTVTWPQQVRTRVAMVHHETSSVNGIFFTFIPVIVDDIAYPLKICVNERVYLHERMRRSPLRRDDPHLVACWLVSRWVRAFIPAIAEHIFLYANSWRENYVNMKSYLCNIRYLLA